MTKSKSEKFPVRMSVALSSAHVQILTSIATSERRGSIAEVVRNLIEDAGKRSVRKG